MSPRGASIFTGPVGGRKVATRCVAQTEQHGLEPRRTRTIIVGKLRRSVIVARVLKVAAWRVVVAGVGCVALTMLAAPGDAAAAWRAPVNLSASAFSDMEAVTLPHQVACDARGDAVAVWERETEQRWSIMGAVRPAGGKWQKPVKLASGVGMASELHLAVGAHGYAVAVWQYESPDQESKFIQSVARPAGGKWQAPVNITPIGGKWAERPDIAVDAQGDALAVWERNVEEGIQSSLRPAAGKWQTPVTLSAPGEKTAQETPQVAVDEQGDAVAVWQSSSGTSNAAIEGAVRPAGGKWQTPLTLSAPGVEAAEPRVAVDAQGDAVVVWERSSARVQGTVRSARGEWQTPVNLSAPGVFAGEPDVAIGAQGNAVAVWVEAHGSKFVVQGAVRPAGGEWQTPNDLSAPGKRAYGPDAAVGAQGNAVAVWESGNGAHVVVQSSVRPAGGGWKKPVNLSPPGEDRYAPDNGFGEPQVALDEHGNAIAVWGRETASKVFLQAASYHAGSA